MSKPFTPKEYLTKLSMFLQEIETHPLVKKRITEQERIIDLFRLWYMDCREQEIYREALEREKDDPFGMLGGGD